jgi:hypothetical protein
MKTRLELIEELLGLPDSIQLAEIQTLDKHAESQEINNQIIDEEISIKSQINAALDDNGKKLYSNDQLRQAAFLEDAKENETLIDLYRRRDVIDSHIRVARIRLDRLQNHQRNIRAVISYLD